MTEGWTCPTCKRGVAPGEKYCDHGGVQTLWQFNPATLPPSDSWPYRVTSEDAQGIAAIPHNGVVT